MDFNARQKKVDQCFDAYEKMQTRHLKMMQTSTLPDLEAMTRERDTIFLDLQQHIERLLENAGTSGHERILDDLTGYQHRLTQINELDGKIGFEIQQHQGRLKTALTRMKVGQSAMKGYGQTAGSDFSGPRVISMDR